MSADDWDAARLAREKRNFVEARRNLRPVFFHVTLILTVTWAAGWASSWALLKMGMSSMPARYAISLFLSYLVFIAAVRVWSDFVKADRRSDGGGWDGSGLEMFGADAGGCLVVAAIFLVAMIVAAVFALTGGLPLLLEVAFEVAFAGVVVRRVSRTQLVGDWLGALIRNTWLHALVAFCALVTIAAVLQSRAPEATTFASAVKALLQGDGRALSGPAHRR